MKSQYTWGGAAGVPTGMQPGLVTVGAASATGAVYVAPKGTALPSSASAAMDSAFVLLGFTSDAGMKIADSSSHTGINAWEERTEVCNVMTEYTEQVTFTPIQCNADVLKLMWGEAQVEETGEGIVARHTNATLEPVCIVVDTTPREGMIRRFCGTFQLAERGEQSLDGTQIDHRALTFKSVPDGFGVTMRDYTAWTLDFEQQEPTRGTKGKKGEEENAGGMYSTFLEPNEPDAYEESGEPAEFTKDELAYLAEVMPELYGEKKDEEEPEKDEPKKSEEK